MEDLSFWREEVMAIVAVALSEDVGAGDVTTRSVVHLDSTINAAIVARQDLIVCGIPVIQEIFDQLDPNTEMTVETSEGQSVVEGDVLMRVSGRAEGVLTAERVALNMLQFLSGIATLTRTYVNAITGTKAVLLDTRKTIPGLRILSKYAVRCGGGKNHRMRLDDGILIKDNHIHVAGDISEAIRLAKTQNYRKLPIQAECDTLDQVNAALKVGVDSLLLDNMSPANIRKAVKIVGGRIPLEASGGITLKTIRPIAETGVDFISLGAITQRAPSVDIGLDIAKV